MWRLRGTRWSRGCGERGRLGLGAGLTRSGVWVGSSGLGLRGGERLARQGTARGPGRDPEAAAGVLRAARGRSEAAAASRRALPRPSPRPPRARDGRRGGAAAPRAGEWRGRPGPCRGERPRGAVSQLGLFCAPPLSSPLPAPARSAVRPLAKLHLPDGRGGPSDPRPAGEVPPRLRHQGGGHLR